MIRYKINILSLVSPLLQIKIIFDKISGNKLSSSDSVLIGDIDLYLHKLIDDLLTFKN